MSAACGLSLVVASRGLLSSCSAQIYCDGASCWGTRAPGHAGFSSCGMQAQ